ncbi:helix hairpin-helix protein (macronuclear) [Tetrahymena thermophila SB210]|uniref:DNA polymerase beta n=1 Tax=Tetrahymena thermophila (strain SB210) TaxID=312017 RepID=Q245F6_TETTS|nr:helix hairpin-helix protein [Tetrahymena thermophila SB210]EAS03408.2 helix hairpin-helix protein [Tetrahymena thermophila SB210]|eukprot:XP_001023653.2 helix hairpin-helix protein [Tetrahymena thermophila SB210]
MSQLDQILEEAVKKNENNKREVKNPLTKEMIQYQKVLESQQLKSQINQQHAKKEVKKEYIVIDEDSTDIYQQNKIQNTQNGSQKVKYVDILKQRQEEINKIPKDLFKSKIVIFFMRNFDLSEKRVKIFAEQIKNNQGEVYFSIQEYFEKFLTFYDLIQEKNKHILFICPDNIKIDELRKQLSQYSLDLDVVINKVVISEYLVEVLKQKKYINPEPYYFSYINQLAAQNNLFHVGQQEEINKEKQQIKNMNISQSQQIIDENSKQLSNSKVSSDEDSIQENSLDLECLTNISRDILRQRKMKQDTSRQKAAKKTRYLWDYNYDSEQEQQISEDDLEKSQNSDKFVSFDSSFEQKKAEYADQSITPIKLDNQLFLSKVTENEEISGQKINYLTSFKKLKRSPQLDNKNSQDQFLFKISKSTIKKEQDLIQQNQTSPSKTGFKNKNQLDYFEVDSDQEIQIKDEQKYLDYLDEDDEDFSKIDQRFITELPNLKVEAKFKNDQQLKSLKKKDKIIEIISLDSDEDEKETNLGQQINDQEQPKFVSQPNIGNPFKPFSGQIRRERYWDERKDHFICATGAPKENFNKLITEELEKLLKIYQQEKDIGRSIAYRKAVGIIKSLDFQIKSVKDVQKINGLGEKTKEKIKEILETGQCQRAQILTQSERNQAIELLSQVWGIGPSTASQLYERNIKTIAELRQNQHLLNKNQKIGLQYFEDLVERMPREEATLIVNEVIKGFKELYPEEHDRYDIIACGSYRRGKETCGDVDILICRKDGEENKPKKLMINLICKLEQDGLLIEHLQFPRPNQYGSETYMGIGKLKDGKHRRIDLKYYPKDLYGYALLYFTGSDYFNRSMRLFARKKGYSLSDHGLYAVNRIDNKTKITSSLAIPCYTEEEVFAALNLEYKPPYMRSV